MANIKNDRALTIDRLKSVLDYDPVSGIFIWRVTISPRAVAWSRAGAIRKRGYRVICIDREQHKASRLAWFYCHGELPSGIIDHKNRNRADDRLENLRLSDVVKNAWNSGLSKNNKSGFKGVHRTSDGLRWQVSIACYGERKYLGSFKSAIDASAAYEDAVKNIRAESMVSN